MSRSNLYYLLQAEELEKIAREEFEKIAREELEKIAREELEKITQELKKETQWIFLPFEIR